MSHAGHRMTAKIRQRSASVQLPDFLDIQLLTSWAQQFMWAMITMILIILWYLVYTFFWALYAYVSHVVYMTVNDCDVHSSVSIRTGYDKEVRSQRRFRKVE